MKAAEKRLELMKQELKIEYEKHDKLEAQILDAIRVKRL